MAGGEEAGAGGMALERGRLGEVRRRGGLEAEPPAVEQRGVGARGGPHRTPELRGLRGSTRQYAGAAGVKGVNEA